MASWPQDLNLMSLILLLCIIIFFSICSRRATLDAMLKHAFELILMLPLKFQAREKDDSHATTSWIGKWVGAFPHLNPKPKQTPHNNAA